MKKTVLMLAVFVFCAAMAFAQGTPITGEWSALADDDEGGASTLTMTQTTVDGQTAYRFQGNVKGGGAVEWPWASAILEPDEASIKAFSSTRAMTFKVRGDGQKYWFVIAISDVKDYAYHRYSIQTKVGETVSVRVPINQMRQPDWGLMRRMQLANTQEIRWDAFNIPGAFDLTVWDIRFE